MAKFGLGFLILGLLNAYDKVNINDYGLLTLTIGFLVIPYCIGAGVITLVEKIRG